ncbi:MAG: flagellar basal body-associated protein FliL [Bacteriovoracales bacterium]
MYILLAVNLFFGLIILHFQKVHFEKPETFFAPPKSQSGPGYKTIIKLPQILTNIMPTKDLKRYLRITPVLILDKEQVLNEIKIKETIIRDKIMSYINKLSEDQILSENGMDITREKIREIINNILSQNKVSMIYFMEFRVN